MLVAQLVEAATSPRCAFLTAVVADLRAQRAADGQTALDEKT
jgi:hypothetical protein